MPAPLVMYSSSFYSFYGNMDDAREFIDFVGEDIAIAHGHGNLALYASTVACNIATHYPRLFLAFRTAQRLRGGP